MEDFYGDHRLEDTAGQCLWAYRQWLRHGHSMAIPRMWRWRPYGSQLSDTRHETTNGMIAAKGYYAVDVTDHKGVPFLERGVGR